MTTISILVYSLLLIIFLCLFAKLSAGLWHSEASASFLFGWLGSFALLGLVSMVLGWSGLHLGWSQIILANLVIVSALGLAWALQRKKQVVAAQRFSANTSTFAIFFLSFLSAFLAGLLFYTPDLLPSALSGDPARHFLNLVDPGEAKLAPIHKPIYYVMGGLFVHTFPYLEKDQLFVVFNIFVLGLSTCSSLLLFRNLFPNAIGLTFASLAVLVSFGYSFFILQYGGYTLVMSSAFLFSVMALLVEFRDRLDRKAYGLVTLMVLGSDR